MGMLIVLILRETLCRIVDISLLFALIFDAVRMEKDYVPLSTSINPPHRSAMDSKVLIFQESKGSPLTEIQL